MKKRSKSCKQILAAMVTAAMVVTSMPCSMTMVEAAQEAETQAVWEELSVNPASESDGQTVSDNDTPTVSENDAQTVSGNDTEASDPAADPGTDVSGEADLDEGLKTVSDKEAESISGNAAAPLELDVEAGTVTGTLMVTGNAETYSYDQKKDLIVVSDGAELTISSAPGYGKDNYSQTAIYVEKDASVKLTLDNIYISFVAIGERKDIQPLEIAEDSTGNVDLILKGQNRMWVNHGAAIQKNGEGEVGTLTIMGDGELITVGGQYAAGIGGDENKSTKNITIQSGTINTTGGYRGAGIGGGKQGKGSYITILGGTIHTTGGGEGAGIGGGESGAGTDITISGGAVFAGDVYSTGGAGIGSGSNGSADNITITGGFVNAYGARAGAGIGTGSNGGTVGTIRITGGTVNAFASRNGVGKGVGIGCGAGGSAENISVIITGGSVRANGITKGAKNEAGEPVYPVRMDLLLLYGKQNPVETFTLYTRGKDETTRTVVDYNCQDLYTLEDGYLYFYLPANEPDTVTGLDFGHTIYEGEIKAFAEGDTTSCSELVLVSSTDGRADYGDVIREDVPEGEDIPEGFWAGGLSADGYTYTGKAIRPEPRVYDGKHLLTAQKDYTLSYKNNINAADADSGEKAPQILITGKGNYKGKLTKNFTIRGASLGHNWYADDWFAAEGVEAPDVYLEAPDGENDKGARAVPVITYNGIRLEENKDYILDHTGLNYAVKDNNNQNNYVQTGTYRLIVRGIGNYTDAVELNVIVVDEEYNQLLMSKVSVAKIEDVTYQAELCEGENAPGMTPDLTVTYGSGENMITLHKAGDIDENGNVVQAHKADYEVTWVNNKKAGTATAILTGNADGIYRYGKFYGEKRITFKIKGTALKASMVSWTTSNQKAPVVSYTGTEWQPVVKVGSTQKGKDASGKTTSTFVPLTPYDEATDIGDYTVSYLNNVNAGTATVVVTGVHGYTGTVKKTFKIKQADLAAKNNRITIEGAGFPGISGSAGESAGQITAVYTKKGARPQILVKAVLEGYIVELEEGKDYTVSYSNNKIVSEGKKLAAKKQPVITIKGKGNYKGSFKQTFTITPATFKDAGNQFRVSVADIAANKAKGKYISKPVVTDAEGATLKEKTDYTLTYSLLKEDGVSEERVLNPKKDVVEAGNRIRVTITGAGNYAGEDSVLTAAYRVTENNFARVSVKLNFKSMQYTGRPVELTADDLTLTIKTGSGKKAVTEVLPLITGGDDTRDGYAVVGYENNVNRGTARVILKGCGKYGGTKTIKFKIGIRSMLWWLKPEV